MKITNSTVGCTTLQALQENFGKELNFGDAESLLEILSDADKEKAAMIIRSKQINFWNELADYYLHRHHQLPFVQKHWDLIIDLMEVREDDTVADLACGAGRMLKELRRKDLRFRKFVGIDYASKMLECAKQDCAANDKIEFLEADLGRCISLPDASVDKCISNWGITYLPCHLLRTALMEIYRILKPSGTFLCSSVVRDVKLSSTFRKLLALPEIALQNRWSVVKEASAFEKRLRLLFPMYSAAELAELFSIAHLEIVYKTLTVAGGSLVLKSRKI